MFFFSLTAFGAESEVITLMQGNSPSKPVMSGKIEYPKATQDAFIRSFYNKNINEEDKILKRYPAAIIHVTLEDCIALALKNNFKIKIANSEADEKKWIVRNRTSKYLPDFYYTYSISNLNGAFLAGGVIPTRVNETAIQDNFYVKWQLIDGGYRWFLRKAAKSKYDAAQKDAVFTREEVLKNVAISYYRLLATKLSIRVLLRNLSEFEAHLEINKARKSEFDILRSQAAIADAKQDLAKRYSEYGREQANLANLLGVEVSDKIIPQEEFIIKKTLVDKNLEIETLSQDAYMHRNDLEALRHEIKALENEKKTIYSKFLPRCDAYGSMGRVGTSRLGLMPSRQVGVLAYVPLGPGVAEYTDFKRYDALIDKANFELQDKYRDIQQGIITYYYAIRSSNMRAFDAEAEVAASDRSLEQAFYRLQKGGLYIDVLQTQVAKTDAKLNLINAIADYNVAQVNMLFGTGALSVYNLVERIDKNPIKEEMDARLEK